MIVAPRPKTWVRSDYERMVEVGILGPGDHVELLEGEIVEMTPEKSRHATAVDLVLAALLKAFGDGYTIRVQHPLALSDHSEPEPDLAVVAGSPRDHVDAHPATALLVVEVADSSLEYDRSRKARVYARAGIAEYWIANLVDLRLEVHRQPSPTGYLNQYLVDREGEIAPLAAPSASIPVADLLP
jgi:Uma2 family endonuclease